MRGELNRVQRAIQPLAAVGRIMKFDELLHQGRFAHPATSLNANQPRVPIYFLHRKPYDFRGSLLDQFVVFCK